MHAFRPHEGGVLLMRGDTPLGLMDGNLILTPSGASWRVRKTRNGAVLSGPDGGTVVEYAALPMNAVCDTATGTTWRLRPNWHETGQAAAFRPSDLFAETYSLEEAQGVVPNRVLLLLAYLMRPALPRDHEG